MHILEYSLIEGIELSVVIFFILIAAVIAICVFMIILSAKNSGYLRSVHPDHAGNVRNARNYVLSRISTDNELITDGAETGGRTRQDPCPICLDTLRFTVETNCGHKFCGRCIAAYWEVGTWLGPVQCPMCRQIVTMIFTCFSVEENLLDEQANDGEKRRILDKLNDYNRRFSGQPVPLMDYIRDLPVLMRYALRDLFSVSGITWVYRVRIIICICIAAIYLVSPFDLVPEAAFGLLGILDDIFILLMLAIYITVIYREVVGRGENA